jgi:hypothetical protein
VPSSKSLDLSFGRIKESGGTPIFGWVPHPLCYSNKRPRHCLGRTTGTRRCRPGGEPAGQTGRRTSRSRASLQKRLGDAHPSRPHPPDWKYAVRAVPSAPMLANSSNVISDDLEDRYLTGARLRESEARRLTPPAPVDWSRGAPLTTQDGSVVHWARKVEVGFLE